LEHYTRIFKVSERVITLSESLIPELDFITRTRFKNVQSISNPLTINHNLEVSLKKKEIIYVGRIDDTFKRVDLLIDIWKKISRNHPQWVFNVLGDGPYLDKLTRRIKEEHIQNINLLGSIDPTENYKSAAILCLASSSESFGLVILEALSYEIIPVLFNSFPVAEEIVSHGVNGTLIAPFDIDSYVERLNELMLNEELRLSMSKASKQGLEKFKLETIASEWVSLIESIASETSV
jgi:glycosyltransferase involved in cell wall biosynthesis